MVSTKNKNHPIQSGLEALQYSIDFVAAILLLTGKITTAGIFVVPEGFFLSATGPILGGDLFEGKTPETAAGLRTVNIIVAVLLILNVIRVTGPYITSGRAIIVFSGEIFGIKEIAGIVRADEMNQTVSGQLRNYVRSQLLRAYGQ